jgi:hypothetical protein
MRAFVILLLLGGAAMAKPGLLGTQPSPTAPIDPEEEFWNSEEGRLVEKLYDDVTSGRATMEDAEKRYNKHIAKKPNPGIPRQVPNAPAGPSIPRR